MVVFFDIDTHGRHDRKHFTANVGEAVDRAFRDVAAFVAGAVPHIAGVVVFTCVLWQLFAVYCVKGAVWLGVELDVVKDEEFWLWAEIGGVAYAAFTDEFLGGFGDGAWVAVVRLVCFGVVDVTENFERALGGERVNHDFADVRDENHVRGINFAPAFYG